MSKINLSVSKELLSLLGAPGSTWSVEHATLDLGVMGSIPCFGGRVYINK